MNINEMKLKDISKETLIKYVDTLKKELPTKWEDLEGISGYCTSLDSTVFIYNNCSIIKYNKNLFHTKEQVEASIAMAQLSQLMAVYNDGWIPDWEDYDQSKYVIEYIGNKIVHNRVYVSNCFLALKTPALADKFLENFEDLIRIAQPLL